MNVFTLVPVSKSNYYYVMCFPSDQECAWPIEGDIVSDTAVVLELEPEYWIQKESRAQLTYEQEWPREVARYAATTGSEISFKGHGIPVIGKAILSSRTDMFWHHLTLAFMCSDGIRSTPSEWERFRKILLTELDSEVWQAPPECLAVLHISEGNFFVLITSNFEIYRSWIASQIVSVFQLKHVLGADAMRAALVTVDWALKSSDGFGVRLRKVERISPGNRQGVILRGQFGRGSDVPITVGSESGESFCVELPL